MRANLFSLFCFGAVLASAAPVAKIGETQYETLESAFAAAETDSEIVLIDNVELTSNFVASGEKTVTLSAAGYKLSSTVDIANNPAASLNSPMNFKLEGGLKLIIKDGSFTNLVFSAISTATKTTTITVKDGVFEGCQFYSLDYASKITIQGGDFTDGVILARSPSNVSGYGAEVEINGGVFNNVVCLSRPYDKRSSDKVSIYSGVFNGCRVECINGEKGELVIGRTGDTSVLQFISCNIYARTLSGFYTPSVDIYRGDFEGCNIEATNREALDGTKAYGGAPTLTIYDGNYTDCNLRAYVANSSKVANTGSHKFTLNIKNGKFIRGQVQGSCGDGPKANNYSGIYIKPTVNIDNGIFESVHITLRSCYCYCSEKDRIVGAVNIKNGIYKYCSIISWGYVMNTNVSGGDFTGCLFVAHAQQLYQIAHAKLVVNNITANGCWFLAKTTEGSGDNNTAKATVTLESGTYIGCSKVIEKQGTSSTKFVTTITLSQGVSFTDEEVVNIDETPYYSFSSAFALLGSVDRLTMNIVKDVYTPAVSVYSTSSLSWPKPARSATEMEIAQGKKLTINNAQKVVDSNFSVKGNLVLNGGYYTGTISVEEGGKVVACAGTKFDKQPVGITAKGGAIIKQDENGDWVVGLPGFYLIVH